MAFRKFRREPQPKFVQCSCGAKAKLIKRRNFTHGRNSVGRGYSLYKCIECFIERQPMRAESIRR